MLSVAQDLVSQLTAYQPALSTALHAAPSLPLSGDDLQNLPEFNAIFQNSLSRIESQTQGLGNGHHQLSIPLTPLAKTFAFELGLDAFLQIHTAGSVQAAINPVLHVGFDVVNGTASLSPLQTNLDIGFQLTLPGFQGTMSLNSLLFVQATDVGSDFQGHLQFNLAAGAGVTPHFSGDAHVNINLALSFADPALDPSFNPTFRTTMDLDWSINSATNQLLAPSISFVNFGLDVESFMDGLLGDIVTTVQKFTKPIQPFIDIFQTPVPIISAFGSDETIGTLLLKGAGSSEAQQTSFTLMLQIIGAVNAIDLSGDSGGAVIPFGTITVNGDARASGGFSFNVGAIGGALDDVFSSPALQDVHDALESLGDYAGTSSTAGFKFPLLENPGPVVLAMLTGNVATMFEFTTGRQHFELAPSIGVGIPGILGIFLSAGVVFDANLTMGYDTAGLLAYAQDPQHPEHLLHGFYFDNSIDATVPTSPTQPPIRQTGMYLQGHMTLQGDLLLGHIIGGLYANVSVELADPNPNPSQHVYLDSVVSNLGAGSKVFNLSGKVYASADVTVELSLPIGPDITLFSLNLAYAELVNFDPPPPPPMNPVPVIHDNPNEHTLLLETSKMAAGSKVVTVQPFHNLVITGHGPAYEADGIRVDYQGGVDLYIERKNNVFFNYYNLIANDATAPDGTTINVHDPFNVFFDEGAPNPYPVQTKPTVMLIGGTGVAYTFRERGDGIQPTVVLAGGYGLNTLIGGTMEFGNFIPSNRVAQAHAHFANVSGFDATGQFQITAQIANAVPPATPSGITGATMYASHGGLMVGGPGNNSFYAMGAGVYEMVGGSWINSFDVSPSFAGVPASYLIDGGGGTSSLVVRVPTDEYVTFENSTLVDKYNPAYKALAVTANAGLTVTAHGVQKVHIIAAAGSEIELGDTSELNVDFSITGASSVTFGGSAAPDDFSVSTEYAYNGRDNRYHVAALDPYDNVGYSGPNDFDNGVEELYVRSLDRFFGQHEGPLYTITRTFGNNGRTQSIPFRVSDPRTASISLNGKGASDNYIIEMGVGTFFDVTVSDSDDATQNSLTVGFHQGYLLPHQATLTDSTLTLEYYTPIILYPVTFSSPVTYFYTASASYSPTVRFGANVDVTLSSTGPWETMVINRPSAPQTSTVKFDGIYTVPSGVEAFPTSYAYDPYMPGSELILVNYNSPIFGAINVEANGGALFISNSVYIPRKSTVNVYANSGTLTVSGTSAFLNEIDAVNVLGNSGTININHIILDAPYSQGYVTALYHTVNVRANSGTINLRDTAAPHVIAYYADAQVNIGDNGNLANVHGVINFSNYNSRYGLRIDDHSGSASRAWLIDSSQTRIGDLTLNYIGVNSPSPYLDIFSKYETLPAIGSSVTIGGDPPFRTFNINGAALAAWQLSAPYSLSNRDGDLVSIPLALSGDPGGVVTYGATNLPAGLTINPSTGIISGAILPLSYRTDPYETVVTASAGAFARSRTIYWYVESAIQLAPPIFGIPLAHEGVAASLGPFTTTNGYNRPVTLSVAGLPTGLTFNPATATVGGVIAIGAAQSGPYTFVIHATDGVETAEFSYQWAVTGLTLASPAIRANHVGDAVTLPIPLTVASGVAATFSATNLPAGLSINPITGVVTGILAGGALSNSPYYVTIEATQGEDEVTQSFYWSVLPSGVSSVVTLFEPGPQFNRRGEYAYITPYAVSSLGLPVAYSVQGLPPGLMLSVNEGAGISGEIAAGAALNSPYHVILTATDGFSTDVTSFDWTIQTAGAVDIVYPGNQLSLVNDAVSFQLLATSSLNLPLTYAASGLPTGLTVNAQTGEITGEISPLASLPGRFEVHVTVTDGTTTSDKAFVWEVWSSYASNVIMLPGPNGVIEVTSPIGTQLTASISPIAGVPLPAGATFPFGFVTFAISGVSPGAAADLVITGFDAALFSDYYKYGATPANHNDHWYNFLFGVATDGDNAAGTGMEIVGANVVLHLVDGGRGDDDLALNGVIYDIGGPARFADLPLAGDYNRDQRVDGSDFLLWQRQFGATATPAGSGADGNSSGIIDGLDLAIWATHFGEPAVMIELAVMNFSPSLSPLLGASPQSVTAPISRIVNSEPSGRVATQLPWRFRDSAFDRAGMRESQTVAETRMDARSERFDRHFQGDWALTAALRELRASAFSPNAYDADSEIEKQVNFWMAIDDCFSSIDADSFEMVVER